MFILVYKVNIYNLIYYYVGYYLLLCWFIKSTSLNDHYVFNLMKGSRIITTPWFLIFFFFLFSFSFPFSYTFLVAKQFLLSIKSAPIHSFESTMNPKRRDIAWTHSWGLRMQTRRQWEWMYFQIRRGRMWRWTRVGL